MRAAPRHRRLRCTLLCAALATLSAPGRAQTLARPGWTGSGIQGEPWWRSAVFYRIAPAHFQDSDGDGVGDLRGVAQRLDYLRSLGVDAIVLQLPFDDDGFDDLLAEASRRHVRLVIGLERGGNTAGNGADHAPAPEAKHWLTRGAAGVLLPGSGVDSSLLLALRRAAAQMPGERVVVSEAPSRADSPAVRAPGSRAEAPGAGRQVTGSSVSRLKAQASAADAPQLVLLPLPWSAGGEGAVGRLLAALSQAAEPATPLLRLSPAEQPPGAPDAAWPPTDRQIAAAVLFSQRSAVLLEYGQELGAVAPERMPWTPGNVTAPPEPPPVAVPSPPPPTEIVYGPYRPYVPPPPRPKLPPAPAPGDTVLPDPDSLPGFTTRPPAGPAAMAAAEAGSPTPAVPGSPHPVLHPELHPVASVVLQERDPQSLLNLYRRLSALHHGNATLRSGSLEILRGSGVEGAVAWLRRAPAGTRTAAPVVIAVNCGEAPAALALGGDLARLHVSGELRSLLQGGQIMGNTDLLLAPHAVFVGEILPTR